MTHVRTLLALALTGLASFSTQTQAQLAPASPAEQSASRVKTASTVATLGTDLFGEQVSLYSGSTEFTATDLALPGNGSLSVALTRRLSLDTNRVRMEPNDDGLWKQYALGDWELDLPFLSGTYSNDGWVVGGNTPGFANRNARCSGPTTREEFGPNDVADGVGFLAGEFWNGVTFRSPAGGESPVLFRSDDPRVPRPGNPAATKLVTADNWYFTCLPELKNSQPGEGFLAHGPDGTKIHFDHMVEYPDRPVSKFWRNTYSIAQLQELRRSISIGIVTTNSTTGRQNHTHYTLPDQGSAPPGGNQPLYVTFSRKAIRIYPTRIEDRFGNVVEYQWTGRKLTGIRSGTGAHGADGRQITLAYDSGDFGLLLSASDGERTVSYTYENGTLKTVTLPDLKQWTFDSTGLRGIQRYISPGSLSPQFIEWDVEYQCAATRRRTGNTGALLIKHPSGAIGRFDFSIARHVRAGVDPVLFCNAPVYIGNNQSAFLQFQSLSEGTSLVTDQVTVPIVFDTLALRSKTVNGVGIPAEGYVWSYSYENRLTNSFGVLSNGTRKVVVTEPQGRSELTFGANFMVDEGQLLEVRRIEGGKLLERTTYQYADDARMDTFSLPSGWGLPLTYDQDSFGSLARPTLRTDINRDGVTFSLNRPGFSGHLQAVHYGNQGGGYGWQEVHGRVQG